MTRRKTVHSTKAPSAIGTYSQAVRAGNTVYVSGQIPLDPDTKELVDGDFRKQAHRVFENLNAVAKAAGGSLADVVKLNVFIIDMANFSIVNEVMGEYFRKPYPARAVIGVATLPKGARLEIDAILELDEGPELGA